MRRLCATEGPVMWEAGDDIQGVHRRESLVRARVAAERFWAWTWSCAGDISPSRLTSRRSGLANAKLIPTTDDYDSGKRQGFSPVRGRYGPRTMLRTKFRVGLSRWANTL